jgi:hypothetical protein
MTDPDLLTLLREADPAERVDVDLDAPPPVAVLARITATPPPRRRRARRRLVIGTVSAAAVVAAAVALLTVGSTIDIDPAARAYAQTAPGEHILHVDLTLTTVMTGDNPMDQRTDEQIWQYRDRTHRVETTTQHDDSAGTPERETFDHVKVGDAMWTRMDDGEIQTLRASDSEEARTAVEVDRDFIASFRRRYASHSLRDAGETQFAGRRARAYEVTNPRAPTPGIMRLPVDSETYYVDAETGDPLGSVKTLALRTFKRPDSRSKFRADRMPVGPKTGEMRMTEIVNRIERLPLTPENRARLTADWVKR